MSKTPLTPPHEKDNPRSSSKPKGPPKKASSSQTAHPAAISALPKKPAKNPKAQKPRKMSPIPAPAIPKLPKKKGQKRPITASSSPVESSTAPPCQKKVAFALQGGGAHGAFTWGVLDKFLEDGRFEIEGLSGTSAGGLNSVALIQGFMKGGLEGARKELRRLWKTVADISFYSPLKPLPIESFLEYYNLDHSPGYLGLNFMKSVLSPYEFNPMNINHFRDFLEDFF